MSNQPAILMYNLSAKQAMRLQSVLTRLKIRSKKVSPEEFDLPVGAVAGMLGNAQAIHTPLAPLTEEMLVFVNFTQPLLNAFLSQSRTVGFAPIALKAVLTPTNMHWNAAQLAAELKKEHEAMHYHTKAPTHMSENRVGGGD